MIKAAAVIRPSVGSVTSNPDSYFYPFSISSIHEGERIRSSFAFLGAAHIPGTGAAAASEH